MTGNELIVGKWYYSPVWDDKDKVAFRLTRYTKGYVHFDEAIRKSKNHFKTNGDWIDTNHYDLFPQHLLDNYLPAGHPDRTNGVRMDDWTPKQGDIVVKIGNASTLYKEGDITIITFYGTHDGVIKLMTPELDKVYPNKIGWFTANNFRLATAAEVSSYRAKQIENQLMPKQEPTEIVVGCWVKRVKYKHGIMNEGDIAEVSSVAGQNIKIVNDRIYTYDIKCFVRIPEKEIPIHMSNYKPQVNDWVVITKSKENWNSEMNKYDGRVVQVIKVPYEGCINFKDDGGWTWRTSDNHFREALSWEIPVTSTPVTTMSGTVSGNMTASGWIPQIGDWVVRTSGLNFGMRAGHIDQIVGFTPEDKNFILKKYTAPRSSTKPRGHAPAKFRQARPDELPIGAKPYTPPAQIVQQEAGRVDRNPHKIIPLYISPDPEPAPEFERSVPLIYIKHR